jgi:hypothetical protein
MLVFLLSKSRETDIILVPLARNFPPVPTLVGLVTMFFIKGMTGLINHDVDELASYQNPTFRASSPLRRH